MFDESVEETLIQQQTVKKQRLLKKYDISLDKLSFEYIEECKNVKELERIVKILRSGEEGYYSELQKHAENHLQNLAPNSRILRKEEPILMKNLLQPNERDIVDNDMKQWENEMSSVDVELIGWNKHNAVETGSGDYIPPIRRATEKRCENKKKVATNNKLKKPMMSDYSTWDQYDADSELLKMDAEEERKREAEEINSRKQRELQEAKAREKEHGRLDNIIKTSQTMPDAEKSCLALREKDRGNEYYKTCNYDDAISYYTASIAICPNAVSYNNRAACYLKQGKYDLALEDVNECLQLDPENTKGLYRRGLCLQHKNRFDEALEDMQAVLRKEPHNLLVQHVAKELRQQCRSVPRSVRMLVEEQQEDKVMEMTEIEAKSMKDGFEVNEWGLARTMCSCYGRLQFVRNTNTQGIAEHLIYKPEDDKWKKIKTTDTDFCKVSQPADRTASVKNKIEEIDVVCNGDVETERIAFKNSNDTEAADESVPKRINIIETVKLNGSPDASSVKEASSKSKKGLVVKDMRGQTPRMKDQALSKSNVLDSITVDGPSAAQTPKEETKNEVKNKKSHLKQKNNQQNKSNNTRENNEKNRQEPEPNTSRQPPRNYEFYLSSEKQPITIASKYTTKVTSSNKSNINNTAVQEDVSSTSGTEYFNELESSSNSSNNNYSSNINENSTSSIMPVATASEKEAITPFQFFQLWTSIKDTNRCLKEKADILRRIPPARLRAILGNKLDGTMLAMMIKSLANEFDITNNEAELVKEYLVSLSNVDRFQIIVEFLNADVKRLIGGLIEKVGGDETVELKKAYLIA